MATAARPPLPLGKGASVALLANRRGECREQEKRKRRKTRSPTAEIQGRVAAMPELALAVGKIARRLDGRLFPVARAAKRPYSVTRRLCCVPEKAGEKNPHLKESARVSPFTHEVSEWDKKLLLWSGRYKKKEDIPPHVSAKMMSATRSKLRVKVAYFAMAFLLLGFVSAVFIGKQDVKKYRSLRYMHISNEEIEETAEGTSAKP